MYYKHSNSIGIRSKKNDKCQKFSFGGLRCEMDETTLRGFADQVLRKLDDGESEKSVHKWVRHAIGLE